MDERRALAMLAADLPGAGDDCAVVDGHVLTTDMLHDRTDFPDGTTRHTAGWRSVAASLSDVAAMGAEAVAAVAAYGAPDLVESDLRAYVRGAREVCESVDAAYVGGDLDTHDEFTVATTALGRTDDPVTRDGARPGEAVCVTGTLGRSAAALELFGTDPQRANELFRFPPRIAAGRALAPHATAMLDSSDGLARSAHQLAAASDCGIALDSAALPVDEAVREVAEDETAIRELSVHVGEDFELVCAVPPDALDAARAACPVPLARVGQTTGVDESVRMDGEPLPDRGWTHGEEDGTD